MGPMFTSRDEWNALAPAGRRAYLRSAVGYTLKAGALGMAILVLVVGAAAYALFRREWGAAARAYGTRA